MLHAFIITTSVCSLKRRDEIEYHISLVILLYYYQRASSRSTLPQFFNTLSHTSLELFPVTCSIV